MATMKDIQSIRDSLRKCKPDDPSKKGDKPLSNREAVRQLAPTLLKMRERGFTAAALVELLQEHKIIIKGRDLSRYLRDFQKPSTVTQPARPKIAPTGEDQPE